MIVDPDFLDHWKTRMLVGNLADECAPLYVLRLWAHCQNRRQSRFDNLTTEALKALCRFPGPANRLEASLTASGFVRRDGDSVIVLGWDEYNASLIASWTNGARGGRPKKTQGKPADNPTEKPSGNPGVTRGLTDKRGEDKTREDKHAHSHAPPVGEIAKPTHLNNPEFQQHWDRWGRHLLGLGKTLTATASESQLYKLADFDLAEALEIVQFSIERGARNLILNGDHRRPAAAQRGHGGPRRRVPTFEEGLLRD